MEKISLGLQVIGSDLMDLAVVPVVYSSPAKDLVGIIIHLSRFSLPSCLFST